MADDTVQVGSGTTIIDLGNYAAAQPSYTLSGSGIDTITIDPLNYSIGPITSSQTIQWDSTATTTNYSWGGNYTTVPTVVIDNTGLDIKDGGDIKVNGKSLTEAIEKIEERLGILKPNPELEERWDKLKELRKQYMELEKDLLEKEKIMKILKET